MNHVFISYSSKDEDIANYIYQEFEKNDIKCWFAPVSIGPTESYSEKIDQAIKDASLLLVIVSSNINDSIHVKKEIGLAVQDGKVILPYKIDEIFEYSGGLNYHMVEKQYFDATPDPKEHVPELISCVRYFFLTGNFNDELVKRAFYNKLAEQNRINLIKKTAPTRHSFGISIKEDPESDDLVHFYERIKRIDIVYGSTRDYVSYRWLTVKNLSDTPTSYVLHKECGENKIPFERMKVRARKDSNEIVPLKVESKTEHQPSFEQVFKIYFDKPLLPGESYSLRYTLCWPSEVESFCEANLSTSISLTRYKKGVLELEFGLLSDELIYGFELFETTHDFKQSPANAEPKIVSAQDDIDLKSLHKESLNGVYYKMDDAKDLSSFQLFYKKSSAMTDNADYDF